MRRLLLLVVLVAIACGTALPQSAERRFEFTYSFTVQNVKAGKPLRIWIPLPTTDADQRVRIRRAEGDLQLHQRHEDVYGNSMLYGYSDKADRSEYHFSITYEITRRIATAQSAELQSVCNSYRFGPRPADLVQLSTGKNLLLNPRQDGAALESFVQPYVEIDRKKWNKLAVAFSVNEAPAPRQSAGISAETNAAAMATAYEAER